MEKAVESCAEYPLKILANGGENLSLWAGNSQKKAGERHWQAFSLLLQDKTMASKLTILRGRIRLCRTKLGSIFLGVLSEHGQRALALTRGDHVVIDVIFF